MVGLCRYQRADRDPEKLALTQFLVDTAFAEIWAVACGQPVSVAGDLKVEATMILTFANRIS